MRNAIKHQDRYNASGVLNRGLKFLKQRLLILAALLLHFSWAQAAVVQNLYSASILVPDQSTQAWDQALKPALEQVLIKLTGKAEVAKLPGIQKSLSRAKAWVQSYSYHEEESQDQTRLWLKVEFDPSSINRLLKENQQSLWSNDRPLSLVWLTVDAANSKALVVDNHSALQAMIQAEANRRGLPILLPAMDLEDQNHAEDANALTNPAVWQWAFARYGVKVMLIGQATQAETWQAQWLLIAGSDSKQWKSSGSSLEAVVAAGIDQAANDLAQQLTLSSSETLKAHRVSLHIASVQDLDDYAKISDYLKQLSFIKGVDLAGVNERGMVFDLNMVGDQEQLVKALSMSNDLAPEDSSNNTQGHLYYRWVLGEAKEKTSENNAVEDEHAT